MLKFLTINLADEHQHFISSLVSVLNAQCVGDEGQYSHKAKSF